MPMKPSIIYIESPHRYSDYDNHDRAALSYILRERCGCNIILYDSESDFNENFTAVKKQVNLELTIAVIVRQQKYDYQHVRMIKKIRQDLSATIPIIVIPEMNGETEAFKSSSEDPVTYGFDHYDICLINLVESLVAGWNRPINWLGAETCREQGRLMIQLENAHIVNYPDDERTFGASNTNDQIVAEALRIKLLPTQFLKAEFDDTLPNKAQVFEIIEPSIYEIEVARLRTQTNLERESLKNSMTRAEGYEPMGDGGLRRVEMSCGNDVNGYAIDPITMENLVTTSFGDHHLAAQKLEPRIAYIESFKRRNDDETTNKKECCLWRLVKGLIFLQLNGFSTPILCIHHTEGLEKDQLRRIVEFIRNERKFIPVDYDCNLLNP